MALSKSTKLNFFLFGLLCLMIQSCSSIQRAPFSGSIDLASEKEAAAILASIQKKNIDLRTFKGIGKIELNNDEVNFITRTAWIGSYPGRFRIEILGISGQPFISLAADHDNLFFLSHADAAYFHRDNPGATLEKLSSIPVTINDIMEFLTGRIPIREHESFYLTRSDSTNSYILTLEKQWTGTTEKIYLDETKTKIYKVEMFDIMGALNYRAELKGAIPIDGFEIPSSLMLANESGESFSLRIDRYFTNIPVAQSMFSIPPPGDKK